MIVIINGAPASGKSKTAQYIFENTLQSAYADGDWLLAATPEDRDKNRLLRYKNLASLAKNYYEAGFINVFLAFVYVTQHDLQEQIDMLKEIDEVKVFCLVPSVETLQKRHQEDRYKRVPVEESIKLRNSISQLENVEVIDNSDLTIEETGNEIKQKLGLQ